MKRAKDFTIIHQIHKDRRMTPREAMIIYQKEQKENRIIHKWKLSDIQPAPQQDHLLIKEHQGQWEIKEHPSGGVQCHYESTYLPGGSIPAWLVRQFQTSEIIRMIEETHRSVIKSK